MEQGKLIEEQIKAFFAENKAELQEKIQKAVHTFIEENNDAGRYVLHTAALEIITQKMQEKFGVEAILENNICVMTLSDCWNNPYELIAAHKIHLDCVIYFREFLSGFNKRYDISFDNFDVAKPRPMRLAHAYRILKCYSERDISGKDCSQLRLDDAIKFVLPILAKEVDAEAEQNKMSVEEFRKQLELRKTPWKGNEREP